MPPSSFGVTEISIAFFSFQPRIAPFGSTIHLSSPSLGSFLAATNYVATVDGELVAHVAVGTRQGLVEARACRLVVMPEWQGAGVGLRFLDAVCQRWLEGKNRYKLKLTSLLHTSHPGLAAALRRSTSWTQVSGSLCGTNRERSKASINRSATRKGTQSHGGGYGGHFRAVQGFRYLGVRGAPC